MSHDHVSIVMPAYNAEAYIGEAIDSVRGQSYRQWDLIVVDDCSSDDTVRVARERAESDTRVTIVQSPANGGSAVARNLGLSQCTGRYIAFLDADDKWVANKLEAQLAFMAASSAAFSFTAYRKFGDRGSGGVVRARSAVGWRDMLKGNRIGCSTVVLDSRAFPPLRFPTDLGRQEDYALWLSLLRDGTLALGLDEPLTLYRVHEASKSARKLASVVAQWRVYREFEQVSRVRASWYLAQYAVRGALKLLR